MANSNYKGMSNFEKTMRRTLIDKGGKAYYKKEMTKAINYLKKHEAIYRYGNRPSKTTALNMMKGHLEMIYNKDITPLKAVKKYSKQLYKNRISGLMNAQWNKGMTRKQAEELYATNIKRIENGETLTKYEWGSEEIDSTVTKDALGDQEQPVNTLQLVEEFAF